MTVSARLRTSRGRTLDRGGWTWCPRLVRGSVARVPACFRSLRSGRACAVEMLRWRLRSSWRGCRGRSVTPADVMHRAPPTRLRGTRLARARRGLRFRASRGIDRAAGGAAWDVAPAGPAPCDRATIEHARIADIGRFLRRGDLLVVNDTRVFAARLLGHRVPSGGAVECLLLSLPAAGRDGAVECDALMHPGQKLKPGAQVRFEGPARLAGGGGARTAVLRPAAHPALGRRAVGRGGGRRACRRHRAHAAAALHQAARRRGGSRAISDDVRRRSADRWRRRRRASTSRRRSSRRSPNRASGAPPSRCTSATARSSRCASSASRSTRVDPEPYEIGETGGRRHQQRARPRGGG